MSTTSAARILFTHFANPESSKLRAWRMHAETVLGGASSPTTAGAEAAVWQLISSNNRELARCATVLAGYEAARAHAARTIAAVPTLVVENVNHERAGSYGWFLRDGAMPLVVCARWFPTSRERRNSSELALARLGAVHLGQGARQYIEHTPTGALERVGMPGRAR